MPDPKVPPKEGPAPFEELIARARFWIETFDQYRSENPSGTMIPSRDAIKATDAARDLICKINPALKPTDVRDFLTTSLTPGTAKLWNYPGTKIESISETFRQSVLEPSGFDIAAIVFEILGMVPREQAAISGLNTNQNEELKTGAIIYAAIRTTFGIVDQRGRPRLDASLEVAIKNIETAAEDEKTELRKQMNLELHAALEKKRAETFSAIGEEKEAVLRSFEKQAEERLNDKLTELTTDLILNKSVNLWKWKAIWHKVAFWIAAIVFSAMVVGPIFYGIENWDWIKQQAEELFPIAGQIPFGRLLIISVPLLGWAWILRLVSRYMNQNLTLGHDADQRKVMAHTFAQLVAEGAVEDDQDRAILLGALFRPTPGTSTEDDQPPNVIGMIKKEVLPDRKS
jgi:hypothetical protein